MLSVETPKGQLTRPTCPSSVMRRKITVRERHRHGPCKRFDIGYPEREHIWPLQIGGSALERIRLRSGTLVRYCSIAVAHTRRACLAGSDAICHRIISPGTCYFDHLGIVLEDDAMSKMRSRCCDVAQLFVDVASTCSRGCTSLISRSLRIQQRPLDRTVSIAGQKLGCRLALLHGERSSAHLACVEICGIFCRVVAEAWTAMDGELPSFQTTLKQVSSQRDERRNSSVLVASKGHACFDSNDAGLG
jgi:hypothetical protein